MGIDPRRLLDRVRGELDAAVTDAAELVLGLDHADIAGVPDGGGGGPLGGNIEAVHADTDGGIDLAADPDGIENARGTETVSVSAALQEYDI